MLPECCNLRPGTPGWERGLTAACKAYVGLGPPGSTARRFLPPITLAQSKPPHPPHASSARDLLELSCPVQPRHEDPGLI